MNVFKMLIVALLGSAAEGNRREGGLRGNQHNIIDGLEKPELHNNNEFDNINNELDRPELLNNELESFKITQTQLSTLSPELSQKAPENAHGRVLTPIECEKPMLIIIDVSNSVGDQRIKMIEGAEDLVKEANPRSLCVIIFAGSAQTVGCSNNPATYSSFFLSAKNTANLGTLGITTRLDRGIVEDEAAILQNKLGLFAGESINQVIISDGVLSKPLPASGPGSYASIAAACANKGIQVDNHFLLVVGADGVNLDTATGMTTLDNILRFPDPQTFAAANKGVYCAPVTGAPVVGPVATLQPTPATDTPTVSTVTPTTSPTSPGVVPPTDYVPPLVAAILGAFAAAFRSRIEKKPKFVQVEIDNPEYIAYMKKMAAAASAPTQAKTKKSTVTTKKTTTEHKGVNPKDGWTTEGTNVGAVPSMKDKEQNKGGLANLNLMHEHGVRLGGGYGVHKDLTDKQAPSQGAPKYIRRKSTEEKADEAPPPPPPPPAKIFVTVPQVEKSKVYLVGFLSPLYALGSLFKGLKPKITSGEAGAQDAESLQPAAAQPTEQKSSTLAKIRNSRVGKFVSTVVAGEASKHTYKNVVTRPAEYMQSKLPTPVGKIGKGLETVVFGTMHVVTYIVFDVPGMLFGKENAGPLGHKESNMTVKDRDDFLKNPNISEAEKTRLRNINVEDLKPNPKSFFVVVKEFFAKSSKRKASPSLANTTPTTSAPTRVPGGGSSSDAVAALEDNTQQAAPAPNPLFAQMMADAKAREAQAKAKAKNGLPSGEQPVQGSRPKPPIPKRPGDNS